MTVCSGKCRRPVPVSPTVPRSSDTPKSTPALWGQSYDGSGAKRIGAATDDLYFGYYDTTHGWTRSLFGFDDAQIREDLTGATITAVSLRFRVKHTFYNAGATITAGTSADIAPPTTWGTAAGGRASWAKVKEGATYTKPLPIAVGLEFKSGSTRSLTFGPGPSRDHLYYGRTYGPESAHPPALVVSYTK